MLKSVLKQRVNIQFCILNEWSLALIGNASGADCRGGGISARGVFDKETRRKPQAFAADAVRYGISTAAWI